MEELKSKVEQFAFHGVLRCKQCVENYLAMDKLVGEKCFDHGGLLAESHKQIAEVLLRDIASNIYKIIYDKSSQIKYRQLKNELIRLDHPRKREFEEYIKKIDELTPSEECLEKLRKKRLAHLDKLEINDDPDSQFIETDFYEWFLNEVRTHGKIRFLDYLEAFCSYSLSILEMDSERFRRECKDIKNKAVIFWGFATKTIKNNSEAEHLLQLSQS